MKSTTRAVWVVALVGTTTMLVLAGILSAGTQEEAERRRAGEPRQLWIFFSPAGQDLSVELRAIGKLLLRHRDVQLRPCLLVDDWKVFEHPSGDFARTLKELRSLMALQGRGPFSIPVWDLEGLALARRLGIERLPAYALLETRAAPGARGARRRAHVAYGRGAHLEDLFRCK